MTRVGRYLFALSLSVLAKSALVEAFCVDAAEEIQTALTRASSNGQDDEIKIVQGTSPEGTSRAPGLILMNKLF